MYNKTMLLHGPVSLSQYDFYFTHLQTHCYSCVRYLKSSIGLHLFLLRKSLEINQTESAGHLCVVRATLLRHQFPKQRLNPPFYFFGQFNLFRLHAEYFHGAVAQPGETIPRDSL